MTTNESSANMAASKISDGKICPEKEIEMTSDMEITESKADSHQHGVSLDTPHLAAGNSILEFSNKINNYM